MQTSWLEVLDELEEFTAQLRRHLEKGTPSPDFPLLPGNIGPLPVECAERAQRLLGEIRQVESQYELIRNRMAHLLFLILEPPMLGPPSYLDKSV